MKIKAGQIWKIVTEEETYYEKVTKVERDGSVLTIDKFGAKSGYPPDMFDDAVLFTLTEYKSFDEINE